MKRTPRKWTICSMGGGNKGGGRDKRLEREN